VTGASIAIVAPAPVPPAIGGAERLWWGLTEFVNRSTEHRAELLKLPTPERDVWEIVAGYERFSELDVSGYDVVISGKYPAWMVDHPDHRVYLLHRLRGLYDTYHLTGLPADVTSRDRDVGNLLQLLDAHEGERAALPEVFARLAALAERRDGLAAELVALPGPFIRRVVHFLDRIALSPGAVRQFATLSATVARRPGYFPAGADVRVAHPMTHLEGLHPTGDRHLLAVSRLDAPKRLDLVVNAMRRASTRLPLLIAGTGPERERLEELAGGDARIRFLGHVNDDELVRLYNDARAVIFAPAEEDFGYIALEAMLAAKPVITTHDAGGPTELVEDSVNGRVVDPDPAALAAAIDDLGARRRRARKLGRQARRRAEQVTWKAVVDAILAP
jgi:glycosyltransferase involved in cell wall biosynthesis